MNENERSNESTTGPDPVAASANTDVKRSDETTIEQSEVSDSIAEEAAPAATNDSEAVADQQTNNSPDQSTATTNSDTPVTPVSLDTGVDTNLPSENSKEALPMKNIITGVAVFILLLAAILFFTEMTGRTNLGFLSGAENARLENTVVARVSGAEITASELQISTEQQVAAAAAQGIDVTDESVRSSIEEQALTLLINTTLLKQEAESRGLNVSDTEVRDRYEALLSEVGGEEVLASRMEEFGVTEEILQRDIRDELLIQKLLDELFAENEIAVSDEEVATVYEGAGGEAAGLPPLADVEPQIVAQITAEKEQALVNSLVDDLREANEIEVLI